MQKQETPHGAWQGISGGYVAGFAKWPGLVPVIRDGARVPVIRADGEPGFAMMARPLPPGRMVLTRFGWRRP